MFATELSHEEMAMTDATPRLVSQIGISRVATIMSAVVLIFLGIVFQWGQVGERQASVDGFWVVHTIATNAWDLLAMRLDAPGLTEILRFWPLLLVAFGLAILLALQPSKREERAPRNGGKHSA
jgi:ABC-type amino acid transport system permease subunit